MRDRAAVVEQLNRYGPSLSGDPDGELRKAVGSLKRRTSGYERILREYAISEDGIRVRKPLTGLRGILSGAPESVNGDRHGPLDSG